MDPLTRKALKHVQEAMREFLALMSMEQPTETQAVYNREKFQFLTNQFERAKSEAIPRALSHLTSASSLLDRTQGDLKKAIGAFEGMIRNQERMWVLAKMADISDAKWKAEYRDCVMRNRRYSSDVDKYIARASRRIGFTYDETGIHVEGESFD